MLYGFLASLVAGGFTTLFLLWSRAKLQDKLDNSTKDLQMANSTIAGCRQAYTICQDQVNRADEEIKTLRGQNDEMLAALQKSGNAGVFAELLQKRNTASNPHSA